MSLQTSISRTACCVDRSGSMVDMDSRFASWRPEQVFALTCWPQEDWVNWANEHAWRRLIHRVTKPRFLSLYEPTPVSAALVQSDQSSLSVLGVQSRS